MLILSSCGSGGSNTTADTQVSDIGVGGLASKGPIANASVNIYNVTGVGAQGALIAGPFITDTYGNWMGAIPANSPEPYMVVVSGGSYIDEATLATVQNGSLATIVSSKAQVSIPVTPITDALVKAVASDIYANPTQTVASAVTAASAAFSSAFGFDPTTVMPADPLNPATNANPNAKAYAAVLGGISSLLQDPSLTAFNGVAAADLVNALSADISDLQLDGYAFGASVSVANINAALPTLSPGTLNALSAATTAFASANPSLGVTTTPAVTKAPIGGGTVYLDRYSVDFGGQVSCYRGISKYSLGEPAMGTAGTAGYVFRTYFTCNGTNVAQLASMTLTVDGADQTAMVGKFASQSYRDEYWVDGPIISKLNVFVPAGGAAPANAVYFSPGPAWGIVHTYQITLHAPGGSYIIDSGEYGVTLDGKNCYWSSGGAKLKPSEVAAIAAGGSIGVAGNSLSLLAVTSDVTVTMCGATFDPSIGPYPVCFGIVPTPTLAGSSLMEWVGIPAGSVLNVSETVARFSMFPPAPIEAFHDVLLAAKGQTVSAVVNSTIQDSSVVSFGGTGVLPVIYNPLGAPIPGLVQVFWAGTSNVLGETSTATISW